MKRNSWLGSLQEARNIPLSIDDAPAPQPVQEIVPTTQNTSRTKSSTKIFTAEDYFHRLKDKNRRMERESFDKNRMKRATDIPAVFVVKKNKPKVESSRPSLPLQKTSSYDRSIIDLKNSTITKTDSKELPKKGGFFAGLTNLFKKKLPKKENLVVNSANDQFEFHVVPEDEKRVEGIQHGSEVANNTQIQGNSKINNSSQTEPNPEYSVVETERLSPTNNTFPESPNAPLWEIFSKSPSFSSFECSNVSSEIHHLNELSNQNVAATEMGEVPKLSDEVSPTPPPDDDDKSMEVWECYQTNDETNSDAMKERKITWLFSNGYQANQASAFENHESDSNEGEGKKPFLPLLFGNIVNTTTTSKKEYSKYYMKPLEIRTSSLKKSKPSSTAKVVKHVSFSSIEIRFYTYTIGQGIPSDGGPSLGLNWNNDPALTLHTDVETFEDFRGGIVPDDADDDEEWDDNWRIPRY